MQKPSRLRARRLVLGVTLYDVSAATKIAVPRLSLLERNLAIPREGEIGRIEQFIAAREHCGAEPVQGHPAA